MRVAFQGRDWHLATSLKKLILELEVRAPKRSTASDGSIGDLKHQESKSYHNPLGGWVHAVDITDDPPFFDATAWAEQLRLRRDPRLYQVIHNRLMFTSYDAKHRRAWEWGPYSGKNSHVSHVHLGVLPSPEGRNPSWSWFAPIPEKNMLTDDDLTRVRNLVVIPVSRADEFRQPASMLDVHKNEPWSLQSLVTATKASQDILGRQGAETRWLVEETRKEVATILALLKEHLGTGGREIAPAEDQAEEAVLRVTADHASGPEPAAG